jgi:DNA-binding NtrC family response regulator
VPAPTQVAATARDALSGATPQGASTIATERSERAQIEQLLVRFDGNRAKVARTLGISRTTLYRKLKEHGLHTG